MSAPPRRPIGRTVAATVIAVALAAPAASAGDIVIRRDGSKAVDVPAVPPNSASADGVDLGVVGLLALVLASAGAVSLRRRALWSGVIAVVAALAAAGSAGAASLTEQVSVATGGEPGNDPSEEPAISRDGRYVAFQSIAQNLVAGDSNVAADVFVRDRQSGTTERVSLASGGTEGNSDSTAPAISADGRFVAFLSLATNLVADDTNRVSDVFVHDRLTGVTQRVSVATNGAQGNQDSLRVAISGDGNYVAFESLASNLVASDGDFKQDVFVHERQTGATELISVNTFGTSADGPSSRPSISADGRHVAFDSEASNLVVGDTNGVGDVFVRDRQIGATERVSIARGGGEANDPSELSDSGAISGDGLYVAFQSSASNLVAGDTNAAVDAFVRDRQTGATERVSVGGGGEANSASVEAAISSSGRHVAFTSFATNLVANDTNGTADVIAFDRQTGVTERISVATDGTEADDFSNDAVLSGDGRYAAFTSFARNLVPHRVTLHPDVFLRTRSAPDCSDTIDNDSDGQIDHPNDPGCDSTADTDETNARCDDDFDNDGDGLTDYPFDPGCSSLLDDDESNAANQPPSCSGVIASPEVLSPANRDMKPISLSGATDPDGDPLSFRIDGVSQDEPITTQGDDTTPDAQLTAAGANSNQVLVRAERHPQRNGRVYRIAYTVSDDKGGTCSRTAGTSGNTKAKVAVQRKKDEPTVDDGNATSWNSFTGAQVVGTLP